MAGCLFGFRTQVKHAVTGGKTGLDGAGRSLLSVLVPNVRIEDPDADPTVELARRLDVSEDMILAWTLVRRSLDGRHRKQVWRGVYKVDVVDEEAVLAKHTGLRAWMDRDDERYGLVDGGPAAGLTWPVGTRVLVVGAGPAGLFAALYLAEAGADVVLFDRGGPVKDRVKQVNGFWRGKRQLDPENNLVFGEGGAGTFSDGKIYTRRRDGEVGYILRRFVRFGARPEILEEGWAHLGTDQVRAILPQFRARLAELGVEVRYHTRVDDLVVEGGRAVGVALADGAVVRGSHVMFAPGHSARDTLAMLVTRGAAAVSRPIAVGARIEHAQGLVDAARYGSADRGELPPASYRLAFNGDHGVKARTFCMCPGGMVVPASNLPGHVVVNGMSFAAQRAAWANSALIVEVEPEHYGGDGPLAGFAWQAEIERRAFDAGGGDYAAPGQRVVDFLAGTVSSELPKVSYPFGTRPADLRTVLPEAVVATMCRAVEAFDQKMNGFAQGVFMAPETRTTAPMRFLRTDQLASTTVRSLFPIGEGAGFGGGIVSSAIDGLRAAKAIVARDAEA